MENTTSNTQSTGKKLKKASKLQSFMLVWFRQYYRYVTAGSCVVLLLLGFFLALQPKLSSARSFSAEKLPEALQKQQYLEHMVQYLESVQREQRLPQNSGAQKLSEALPQDPQTAELLTVLEEVARSSGVTIKGMEFVVIEPDAESKELSELFSTLPAGVQVVEAALSVGTGPYDSLKSLLDNMEKSLRLLDVVGLSYSPLGNAYALTVRSYFYP